MPSNYFPVMQFTCLPNTPYGQVLPRKKPIQQQLASSASTKSKNVVSYSNKLNKDTTNRIYLFSAFNDTINSSPKGCSSCGGRK